MAANTKQRIVSFVRDYRATYHTGPAYEDVARHLGVAKSTAWKHIQDLIWQGELEIDPERYRTLRVKGEGPMQSTEATGSSDKAYIIMVCISDNWAPCASFLHLDSAQKVCDILNRRIHGDNVPENKYDRFFRIETVPFSPPVDDSGTGQLFYIRNWAKNYGDTDDEREFLTIPEAAFDYEEIDLWDAINLYHVATAPERHDDDFILLGGDDDDQ